MKVAILNEQKSWKYFCTDLIVKILINVRGNEENIRLFGGIAHSYLSIKNKFSKDVEYFTVGNRTPRGKKNLYKTLLRILSDYWGFFLKVRNGEYDIVHLNPSLNHKSVIRDGFFIILSKFAGTKVIVNFQGWDDKVERLIKRWFLFLFRMTYFRSDAIIVQASEFRDKLVSWGYRKEVFLVTTIVDDELIQDIEIPKVIEQKLRSTNITLLFLSRIAKDKGIYEALETYKILKNKYPNLKMIFAGDGPDLESLKKLVFNQNLQHVEFLGYIGGQKKRDAFTRSDIYIFPTFHREGMPTAVLEAIVSGLPVVTRSVGGIKDFVKNGKMGFVTRSEEPMEFARLVEILIKEGNLRKKISLYNHEYGKENFTASRIARRLEKIYCTISEEVGA